MINHCNRSIGLIAAALTLSAGAPAVVCGGGTPPRPGPAQEEATALTVRAGGGGHPALFTEADRRRMRVRTALFTDADRRITVMRTALFTPQDQQRMAVRTAAFQPGVPQVPGSRPAAGLAGR